jgi:hypothetical protein
MGNIQVFQLIERKNLHDQILPHIEKLMSIDKNVRLITKILVDRSLKHMIIRIFPLARFQDEYYLLSFNIIRHSILR